MDEPLHHIIRAQLPWRDDPPLTECGRAPNDVAGAWTLDEARTHAAKLGQARFALVVCMTCAQTAGRWPTWERDPATLIARQARYADLDERLRRELHALALLAAAHRAEFDETVAGLADVTELRPRRQARPRGR